MLGYRRQASPKHQTYRRSWSGLRSRPCGESWHEHLGGRPALSFACSSSGTQRMSCKVGSVGTTGGNPLIHHVDDYAFASSSVGVEASSSAIALTFYADPRVGALKSASTRACTSYASRYAPGRALRGLSIEPASARSDVEH